MNQEVKRLAGRASAAFGALGLGVTMTVASLLSPTAQIASALTATGGQVQSRSIYMSTSTPSATAKYLVTFKAATSGSIQGLVVDFCGNDPIVGDTCNTPTGFTVGGSPTVNLTSLGANYPVDPANSPTQISPSLLSGWTASSTHSGRTLKLTNSSGQSLTAGTLYGFEITGITNPSTLGTFYSRIVTYATNGTDFTNYDGGSEGTVVDYGGYALSTANVINITAKVQETLSFCVTGDATVPGDGDFNTATPTGNTCTDSAFLSAHLPNLTIGHGTTVKTIDSSVVDRTPAYFQISTNATTGAAVRMKAGNTCANAGISTNGGSTCNIPGVSNNGATNAQAMTAGNAMFGLYVGNGYTTGGIAASTGTFNAHTKYNNASHVNESTGDLYYGMDNSVGTGVTGTYGSLIGSTTGPANTLNAHLVFGATAALTTPAGIYTGTESLIATGTF